MANTAAAFLGKKAYPYFPAPPPRNVEFKKYTLEEAINLDLELHCQNILSVYDQFVHNKRFDSVIFGAPNGGIVNLAAAMGVPYLCSQFRIPISLKNDSGSKDKDELKTYTEILSCIGEHWTAEYLWGNVSCLVDPIHDRMDMGEYAHVREKFTDIPRAFEQFLLDHLKPNGAVIFVNTTYPWVSHRLRDRVHLQIGGLGAISPIEYLTGSEKINQFLKAEKSEHQNGWRLADYPVAHRPESEWGTETELKAAVQEFCQKNGYDFLPLEQDNPAGFNLLAAQALYKKHTADGGKCGGYSINIFWGLCPTMMLRARLLGCWFTFTDRASLDTSEGQLQILLRDFPDVPKRAILGYYWSYPGAKLLDIVTPNGWLNMLSNYIPRENLTSPGVTDLESTEHDIFQYEDKLFEESQRLRGSESKHNVTVEELRNMIR
jgi:hypothetical protein